MAAAPGVLGRQAAWALVAPLLRVALYVGAMHLLLVGLLDPRAADAETIFAEYGRLETAQVVLGAIALLVVLATGWRRPASRPVAILLGAALVALLVREHNNFFKARVGENVWQAVVATEAAVALAWVWRLRAGLGDALRAFHGSGALGWCGAGLLVFLAAQHFDEKPLWELILGSDPPFVLRRVVEEATETLGVFLVLAGVLEWAVMERRRGGGGEGGRPVAPGRERTER